MTAFTSSAAAAATPGVCCRAKLLAAAPLPPPSLMPLQCFGRPASCQSWRPQQGLQHHCSSMASAGQPAASRLVAAASVEGSAPLVAVEGDIVTLHWKCFSEEGELLESSEQSEDPTTFEVGAGDIVGNRLFEAFDEAVRGLAVGDITELKAEGGDWNPELLFVVPREHEEVQRLEGRYKNMGGLKEGLVVELSNGGMALVVKKDDASVTLDANNMLAGKSLVFQLELVAIERPS